MSKVRTKLTTQERGVYSSLFNLADPIGVGKLEGKQAVEFFKKSGLGVQVLREIWELSCPNGESYLDRERFYVSLKLISLAQSSLPMTIENVIQGTASQLPKIESQTIQETAPAQVSEDTWLITSEQKEKYNKLFDQISQGQKEIGGDNCKQLFTQTQLSWQVLGQIWNLADSQDKGKLNREQFYVAMHIIHNIKNLKKEMPKTVPTSLLSSSGYKPDLNDVFDNLGVPSAFNTMPPNRGVAPVQGNVSASVNLPQGFQNPIQNQQEQNIYMNAYQTMAQNMYGQQSVQQPAKEVVQKEKNLMGGQNDSFFDNQKAELPPPRQNNSQHDNLLDSPLLPQQQKVQVQKQPIVQQSVSQMPPIHTQVNQFVPQTQELEALGRNQKTLLDQSKQLEHNLTKIQTLQNEQLSTLQQETQQMQEQIRQILDRTENMVKTIYEQKQLLNREIQQSTSIREQISAKTQEFFDQTQNLQQIIQQRQEMSKQLVQQFQKDQEVNKQGLQGNATFQNIQNQQQAPKQVQQQQYQQVSNINQLPLQNQQIQQPTKQISQPVQQNQTEKQQNYQLPQSTQKTQQSVAFQEVQNQEVFQQKLQNDQLPNQASQFNFQEKQSSSLNKSQEVKQTNKSFEQSQSQQLSSKVERPLTQRNEMQQNQDSQLLQPNQQKIQSFHSTEVLNVEQKNQSMEKQPPQNIQKQQPNRDFFNDFASEFGFGETKKPQVQQQQSSVQQKVNEQIPTQKITTAPITQAQPQSQPQKNNDPFSQNQGGFDFNANYGQQQNQKNDKQDLNFDFGQSQAPSNQNQNDPFAFDFNANFSNNPQAGNNAPGFDFNFN